jgi:hypothetical protein
MKKTYLPACAREGDASNKSVVEIGNVDPEIVECHALGSRFIPQALNRVQLLQRRITGRINEPKDEDERNNCLRLAWPLDLRRLVDIVHILAHRIPLEIGSNKGADDGEDDYKSSCGNEELRSSTPFVCVESTEDCTGEGDDVLHAVVEKPCTTVGYTCASQHGGIIIRDGSVTRPLSKESHGKDKHGTVTGFARIEELLISSVSCRYQAFPIVQTP